MKLDKKGHDKKISTLWDVERGPSFSSRSGFQSYGLPGLNPKPCLGFGVVFFQCKTFEIYMKVRDVEAACNWNLTLPMRRVTCVRPARAGTSKAISAGIPG